MSKTGRNCPCASFVRSVGNSENKGIPQQLGRRQYSFSQIGNVRSLSSWNGESGAAT